MFLDSGCLRKYFILVYAALWKKYTGLNVRITIKQKNYLKKSSRIGFDYDQDQSKKGLYDLGSLGPEAENQSYGFEFFTTKV